MTSTLKPIQKDEKSCIIKYVPFQSTAEPSFWMKLGEYKLNTLKLNEDPIDSIAASYGIVPILPSHRVPATETKEAVNDSTNALSSIDTTANTTAPVVVVPGRMRFDQDSILDEGGATLSSPSMNKNESVGTRGNIIILNTIESFKTVSKNEILNRVCLPPLLMACGVTTATSAVTTDDDGMKAEEALTSFFCLTHLDLKSHRVVYWFAFPFLVPRPGKAIRYTDLSSCQRVLEKAWGVDGVINLHEAVHSFRVNLIRKEVEGERRSGSCSSCPPFFLVILSAEGETKKKMVCLPLANYETLLDEQKSNCVFVFLDPTVDGGNEEKCEQEEVVKPVGWTLRNLIAYLTLKLDLGGKDMDIISFRPGVLRRIQDIDIQSTDADGNMDNDTAKRSMGIIRNNATNTVQDSSLLLKIHLPNKDDYKWDDTINGQGKYKYNCMGWELNARSKPGPRTINLAPLLSPSHLAQQATDLNLKLMKWRMIPNLDLPSLSSARVLLLGAGTLGCSVARTLLGWGVRDITFVDNGKVSYSNPVRQNLFEVADCENGGKDKAIAAAEALKRIAGSTTIKSEGVVLTIPMPGHAYGTNEEMSVKKDVERMHQLVDRSDVVFLLTDTRESRWLPTVMTKASGKMMINAALGLDSWLVMRHGGNDDGTKLKKSRLGCYFCNDVVAPENSTNNRTLDQQCTVTRPGLAPIASSMAVELMVSLMHHPDKENAPAPYPASNKNGGGVFSPIVQSSSDPTTTSPLGVMPHQIRGSIVTYTIMTPTVPAFRHCTGCCDPVVDQYKKYGIEFVKKVCNSSDNSYLEDIAGLTKFREEAASKFDDCLNWDEVDEDDENQDSVDADDF